eukprot:SAG31_NODE_1379_length_8582_cov_17.482848_3_plen_907_part_00
MYSPAELRCLRTSPQENPALTLSAASSAPIVQHRTLSMRSSGRAHQSPLERAVSARNMVPSSVRTSSDEDEADESPDDPNANMHEGDHIASLSEFSMKDEMADWVLLGKTPRMSASPNFGNFRSLSDSVRSPSPSDSDSFHTRSPTGRRQSPTITGTVPDHQLHSPRAKDNAEASEWDLANDRQRRAVSPADHARMVMQIVDAETRLRAVNDNAETILSAVSQQNVAYASANVVTNGLRSTKSRSPRRQESGLRGKRSKQAATAQGDGVSGGGSATVKKKKNKKREKHSRKQQHYGKAEWARMSKGDGVHLSHTERQQRAKTAAVHAIRQMMHSHRHLFGEEITDVKHLFHAIDKDRSGTVSKEEFDGALTRLGLGLSREQLYDLWSGLDADGNGTLEYEELLAEIAPVREKQDSFYKRHQRTATTNGYQDERASASPAQASTASRSSTLSQFEFGIEQRPLYASDQEFLEFGQQLLDSRTAFASQRQAIAEQIAARENQIRQAHAAAGNAVSGSPLDGHTTSDSQLSSRTSISSRSTSRAQRRRGLSATKSEHYGKADWARMSKGDGVHLSHTERQQRAKTAAVHAIRQMMHSHRHLFGEEITDVKHLFHAIDKDRSGTVSKEEFDGALTRLGLGLSHDQLYDLWSGLDADGNGTLEYEELLAEIAPVVAHTRKGSRARKEAATFEQQNTTTSGELSHPRRGNKGNQRSNSACLSSVKVGSPSGKSSKVAPRARRSKKKGNGSQHSHKQQHYGKADWARMSKGDGVHLSHTERQQREKTAAVHAIRQMMHSHRHLFGEEITDVKHLFHAIDKDRSGTVSKEEFDGALTRLGLGLSREQLYDLWSGLDADGNGTLEYEELLAEMGPRKHKACVSLEDNASPAPAAAVSLSHREYWEQMCAIAQSTL